MFQDVIQILNIAFVTIPIGRTQPGAAAQQFCRRHRRKIEQAQLFWHAPKAPDSPAPPESKALHDAVGIPPTCGRPWVTR